ncbi:MAG: YdcF family protein [Leptolyngbya sp. DLM2.Bin15]|nr:MAG: YdcF family protein [Leptolyngbya sp. DLM2.Bin15]
MFFFLSKFLPTLVFPLGFTCLMIVIALITLWRRPRWAAGSLAIALIVLLVSSNTYTAEAMLRSLEWQHIPAEELPNAEAIVVLGGAVRAQEYPRPWVDVLEEGDRPLHGAQLYLQGKAPLVILSGGRIDWFGARGAEADDMAEILEAMGVPPEAMVLERTSFNTYENAVNVKQILDQRGINRVLLVTSAVHMPRSLKIFEKQGIEAIPAPTDFIASSPIVSREQTYQAAILRSLPEAHNLQHVTRVIREYIGIVVYWLKGWL